MTSPRSHSPSWQSWAWPPGPPAPSSVRPLPLSSVSGGEEAGRPLSPLPPPLPGSADPMQPSTLPQASPPSAQPAGCPSFPPFSSCPPRSRTRWRRDLGPLSRPLRAGLTEARAPPAAAAVATASVQGRNHLMPGSQCKGIDRAAQRSTSPGSWAETGRPIRSTRYASSHSPWGFY